jgi:hypothetical protein
MSSQFVSTELSTVLETPLLLRANVYFLAAMWNSQTFFIKSIQPIMYTPTVNFPFQASATFDVSFDTTRNRNIAMSYASLRLAEYLYPKSTVVQNILTSWDLSDLTDPRDIGNIAVAAIITYAKADGWNSESVELPIWKHFYSDYTDFVPTNDAYELKNVAEWQPLVETRDDGNFVVQQHITPQIRGVSGGFAVTRQQLDTIFRVKQRDLFFKHDGSVSDPLSDQELEFLKKETDIVLDISANLNEEQKVVAQFFDNKVSLLDSCHSQTSRMTLGLVMLQRLLRRISLFTWRCLMRLSSDGMRRFGSIK